MTKTLKTLEIFYRLMNDGHISTEEIKLIIGDSNENYNKYVKRYMKTISEYLDTHHHDLMLEYQDGIYRLNRHVDGLTKTELLMLFKVLYATKALPHEELTHLIARLYRMVPGDNSRLYHSIETELYHYNGIMMEAPIVDCIEEMYSYIEHQQVIEVEYINTFNVKKKHIIRPLHLTFNEHYFYIIGIHQKEYPMILRVDRIEHTQVVNVKIDIKKYEQVSFAELKDRLLYMYNGERNKVVIELNGPFIEYVYDKFPHAKLLQADYVNHHYLIEIEAVGDGIMMWLLSQGSRVKVVSPFNMVEKYKHELKKMLEQYNI